MLRHFLDIYLLIVFIDAIVSYFPEYRNSMWAQKIKMIADFTLNPIRKFIVRKFFSPDLQFDVSPVILFVIVFFIRILW
ncbi:MAG: YggT family protein [Bacteriovoracaceae bacterium]|nr:YggT family protein [Bacteriovoracaceae bacterium]